MGNNAIVGQSGGPTSVINASLAGVIRAEAGRGSPMLVDCLTLWLSNVMLAGRDLAEASATLLSALAETAGPMVLVSNEVGWGVVPMAAVSRLVADEQGRLNQRVAAVCDQVTLVAAGLPVVLK